MIKSVILLTTALVLSLAANTYSADTLLVLRQGKISDKIATGDTITISLKAIIDRDWHIWGHKPADKYLIPTVLSIKNLSGGDTISITYPEGTKKTLMGLSEYMFEDTIEISIRMRILTGADSLSFTAELSYQGCNDKVCLPPAKSVIAITLPIDTKGEQKTDSSLVANRLSESGFFTIILFLFISGIVLCLTPCVYPVIPITISFFASQSGGNRSYTILLAIFYTLGIALMYSLMGLIAAMSGSILGTALQHPAVIIVISLLFLAFALSMFGMYEFRLPASLNNLAVGRKGLLGALLMGLIVGVVAAPCIGPVTAGLLLFVAEKKDPLLGFVYFFALAAGLGTPFFFIAIFSNSLKKLPISGEWLNWVKKLFGFILVAVSFYFLIPIIGEKQVNIAIKLTVVIAAIYLGFIEKSASIGNRFKQFRRLFAITTIAIGGWLSLFSIKSANNQVEENMRHTLFSKEAFNAAMASGKPFVIDFRADWCAPCRAFEATVLTDKEVIATLEEVPFYSADLTNRGDRAVMELASQFRVTGVPTIIFFSKHGIEITRHIGFMDKEAFLQTVKSLIEAEE